MKPWRFRSEDASSTLCWNEKDTWSAWLLAETTVFILKYIYVSRCDKKPCMFLLSSCTQAQNEDSSSDSVWTNQEKTFTGDLYRAHEAEHTGVAGLDWRN